MPAETLLFMAEVSVDLGLIGVDEYRERVEVALWLSDDDPNGRDPRNDPEHDHRQDTSDEPTNHAGPAVTVIRSPQTSQTLGLVALSKWYFTGSDPDPYPSVPHGHYQSSNRSWPKLNPYTGRVFKAKHAEDVTLRLSKREMRDIWRDESFRDFCRKHIMWFMQAQSHYAFRVKHPLRLPRW